MTGPDDLSRRILGWGLAAPLIDAGDIGRDLVLVRRPGGGLDLGCVAGGDNLGQDLAMALTTSLGSDPFNTRFGFDGLLAFVQETQPALVRDRLRASVAKTISLDPRVRAVTSVDVTPPDEANDRTLELAVSVDTIAGQAATLVTPLG